MGGHSNWPEWIYIGVVISLMCWVGAEAWEAERLVEHVPEALDVIASKLDCFEAAAVRMTTVHRGLPEELPDDQDGLAAGHIMAAPHKTPHLSSRCGCAPYLPPS